MHANAVLADPGEGGAERRIDQPAYDVPAREDQRETPQVGGAPVHVELEVAEDRRNGDARKAIRPPRQRGGLVRDFQAHRGHREGQHELGKAMGPQYQGARGETKETRCERARQHLQERVRHAELGRQDAGDIRSQTKKRGMAQRDDPGVAEDQVERQGEQDVGEDARAQRQVVGQQEENRQRHGPWQPLRPAQAIARVVSDRVVHARFPKRPIGRHNRRPIVAA